MLFRSEALATLQVELAPLILGTGIGNRRAALEAAWRIVSDPIGAWFCELHTIAYRDEELRSMVSDYRNEVQERSDDLVNAVAAASSIPPEAFTMAYIAIFAMQGVVINDMLRGPSGQEGMVIDSFLAFADMLLGPEKPV